MSQAPISLAALEAALPPIQLPDGRVVAVRRAPASLVDTLAPIAAAHGEQSWAYFRALLKGGAPDLTDADLDGLSVEQAAFLGRMILQGYDEAQRMLATVTGGEDAPGNAAAEATGPMPASTSAPSASSPSA